MKIVSWNRGQAPQSREDECATEEPLAIVIDGRTVHITMRTPGHDPELALGFLLAEGICELDKIASLAQDEENRVEVLLTAGVTLDYDRLTRHVLGSASCGLCGTTVIERMRLPFPPVRGKVTIAAETLLALPHTLRAHQQTFQRTGGLHAAAVFDRDGNLLIAREDIGRHNAVDKILGWGAREKQLPFAEKVLLVSGRTSFEILQKALAGGFAIVAAVSAPSSLAVQFARENGQTLIGFLRDDRFNVYCGENRVRF